MGDCTTDTGNLFHMCGALIKKEYLNALMRACDIKRLHELDLRLLKLRVK